MKTTIFDYFDAIYCINLDKRPDRWEWVKKEFEKIIGFHKCKLIFFNNNIFI